MSNCFPHTLRTRPARWGHWVRRCSPGTWRCFHRTHRTHLPLCERVLVSTSLERNQRCHVPTRREASPTGTPSHPVQVLPLPPHTPHGSRILSELGWWSQPDKQVLSKPPHTPQTSTLSVVCCELTAFIVGEVESVLFARSNHAVTPAVAAACSVTAHDVRNAHAR